MKLLTFFIFTAKHIENKIICHTKNSKSCTKLKFAVLPSLVVMLSNVTNADLSELLITHVETGTALNARPW